MLSIQDEGIISQTQILSQLFKRLLNVAHWEVCINNICLPSEKGQDSDGWIL